MLLSGCHEEYERLSFQPTDTPTQAMAAAEPIGPELPVSPKIIEKKLPGPEKNGEVPFTCSLLPVPERKTVFDALLGQDKDVFFMQEPGTETLVAFDDEHTTPVRMVQACRIGNEESAVLILVGISDLSQEVPTTKVYTFEKGRAAGIELYRAGKDNFLQQFQNAQIITKPKEIQGITGATPIWKPIAEQARRSYQTLLKNKADAAWINSIQQNGKIWHRGNPVIAQSEPPAAAQPENTVSSPEQPDSLPTELSPKESVQSLPEFSSFIEDNTLMADSESDLLYEHWKVVAAAEIALLVCGLLIIAVAQFKRTVYK